MSNASTIVQSAEMVTRAAQMVTASAVVNIISWALLIYAALKLRQTARDLKRAAQAMSARQGQDRNGLGAKPASAVAESDAPNLPPKPFPEAP